MSAPAWFNYATYVANKLAQLQSADPEAGWTSESLQAAFTAAGYSNDADGMYQHFVDWGNAENVSPSPYFVVSEYMANKLAQLQSAEPAAGWDMTKLEQAFKDAGLSAWDHYTLYGQDEGISPSSLFDNNAYLAAKLAQLQSTEPDAGWESVDQVVDAFQAAGLNPIEHYMLYGVSEALTYTPVAPVDPETPVTNELTVDRDVLNLGAGDHVIGGVASALSAEKTLNENDLIDGGEGNDTLRVTMNGNFNGFTVTDDPNTTGGMKNVENVELTNNGSIARTFSAKGIEGATTYTLKAGDSGIGAINLKDLSAAGIAVNVDGLQSGSTSVEFASGALSGAEDSLTLGVSNVGTAPAADGDPTSVNVKTTSGLESVTINASGPNYVNLAGVDAPSLAMTGSGALNIEEVNAALETFDGSAATGNVTAHLESAAKITSIVGTQGDDTFYVTSLDPVATLEGGAGNDTLWLDGMNNTLQPTVSGFETIGVKNNTGLTLSSKNAQDFTAVSLESATVTLASLNASAFTVNSLGKEDGTATTNAATLSDPVQLTINVEAAAGVEVGQQITSNITASNATDVVLNVGANVQGNGTFKFGKAQSVQLNVTGGNVVNDVNQTSVNSVIQAGNATDLSVTADANVTLAATSMLGKVESLSLTQNDGAFNVSNATLDALSSLTITGSGKESAATFGALGSDKNTYRLNVTADGLAAGLTLGDVVTQDDVTLDFDNVTGNVTVDAITGDDVTVLVARLGETSDIASTGGITATGSVTVDASGNLGENLKIGDITLASGAKANAAVSVTVDGTAALTLGAIDASAATKGTVTVDLSGYLEDVAASENITGNTVNFYGSELGTNTLASIKANAMTFTGGLDVDSVALTGLSGTSITAKLDTGTGADEVTISTLAGTESITVSGDMGGDQDDTLTIDNTAQTSSVVLKTIDLSGLSGYTTEITLDKGLAQTVKLGKGQDTLTFDAKATSGNEDTIQGFSATDGDVLDVSSFIALTGTSYTGALESISTTGKIEANGAYYITGSGAITTLSGLTADSGVSGNAFIVYLDSSTGMLSLAEATIAAGAVTAANTSKFDVKIVGGIEGTLTMENFSV